ncbi:MAG TPA: hypothetical protein VGI97_10455 [Gemmatimonadaceae bacterium]|jgi:hypothetical protein
MMRARRTRMIALLATAFAAAMGGCTDVVVNPTTVTALEFDSLPYPAVITGDTLRDSLGAAAPLHAVAFNSAGAVIPNASITYLALDSGVTIDPSGIVTAQLRNGPVRLIASAPGLQTGPIALIVARRPDTVIVAPLANDTLFYTPLDNAATNVTPALSLQVATRDSLGGVPGTQGWLVSYQLFFHGQAVAATDTTVAVVWNSGDRPSRIDTTASDGTSSRIVRVHSTGLPTAIESLTVVANVKYRGAPVPGSPVTYLIQLRPQPAPTGSARSRR